MRPQLATLAIAAGCFILPDAPAAADPLFSGPQPGEKTTPFKVIDIGDAANGPERDPIEENAGAPTVLVFVHTVERSLVPLLRGEDPPWRDHFTVELLGFTAVRSEHALDIRWADGRVEHHDL